MKKVFANSLPKSGTNLLGKCLELFGYKQVGGFASSQVLHNDFKSKVRRYLWTPVRHGYLIGIDSPVEIARWPIDRKIAGIKEGMFLFGHLGYTIDLLEKLRQENFSLLLMLRDPRAVLNSFVHYMTVNKKHSLHSTFLEMSTEQRYLATLHGIVTPKIILQPMSIRCQSLAPWLNSPHVLKIRFEDLIGEKGGSTEATQKITLKKIAAHLDLPTANIEKVTKDLFGPGRVTFRKGTIDSWRTEVPEEVIPIMNKELNDILKLWGYLDTEKDSSGKN